MEIQTADYLEAIVGMLVEKSFRRRLKVLVSFSSCNDDCRLFQALGLHRKMKVLQTLDFTWTNMHVCGMSVTATQPIKQMTSLVCVTALAMTTDGSSITIKGDMQRYITKFTKSSL